MSQSELKTIGTGRSEPWSPVKNEYHSRFGELADPGTTFVESTSTGRCWDDETKLYCFLARYYDCRVGVFIQRDPLEYVDGASLYRGI